jgi:methylenetetrahydrofolate reductase (NADPH)
MCKKLLQNGIHGLHFYTMNLEKSVRRIVEGLELFKKESVYKTLPWNKTANAKREKEGKTFN